MSTRIELNLAGFNALRKSPEVMADLQRRAEAIAEAAASGSPAGATFYVDDKSSATRGRIRVQTGNQKARKAEAEDAALTRAIDAGRS